MSRVVTAKYYCDRCGKEIDFEHIIPTLTHYFILDNSWRSLYESKKMHYELCYECGKKLTKFLKNEELTD